MTPLIPLLSETEALERGLALGINDYIAKMNLFRTLLQHPQAAKELNSTIIALVSGDRCLSDREREILIMRVAWLGNCEYEWGQHWVVSLIFGMKEEEIAAVRDWQHATCFTEKERVLLAMTDAVLAMKGIPEKLRIQLAQQFPEPKAQTEIIVCIANWHMFAVMLNAFEIPLEPTMPSWPPDGKR